MGTEVKWTKDQQDVIDLRDRDILVSAAAGSGKTAVLVERIIEKITDKEHPCDIDRLLVVTFTKAAAAEMRSRIGEALEKRLMDDPENEHIQRQMSLLPSAQISTIDSFCQSVVRNYFHVIDLDPVYRIADETDLDLIKQDVLSELLEEKYMEAKEKKESDFFTFTEIFSTGRTDYDIEDIILNLYHKSTSMPWQEEWIMECGKNYEFSSLDDMEQSGWVQALLTYIRKNVVIFLEKAKQARKICSLSGGPEAYIEMIESDISFFEQMQERKTFGEYQKLIQGFVPMKLKAVRKKNVDTKLKEQVQALREGYLKKGILVVKEKFFFQEAEEMFSDMKKMAPCIHQLVSLVLDFHKAFSAKKQEENLVDFADVEHFALNILVSREETGEIHPSKTALELQEFYDEIMIDEYQDSNEVQELILSSLCGGHGQKPTLFMVGDVKQSIYKFRMAKPEIFLEKYKRFQTGRGPEQRIDLHQNFRSRASVLEGANYFFEHLMTEDLGGIAYDDAARLVPGAEFEETEHRTASVTEVIFIDRDSSQKQIGSVELEAAVIGGKIREVVQGENPLYISGKNGYHPAEYRDIAILLRTMSGWAETFIQVLNDMGIPAYADTKTGYFTSLEVETLLNYLHIIDNPRQDIPLAAVLRSCLFKVTDEELAVIGAVPGEMDFWDQVVFYEKNYRDTGLGEKLHLFIRRLESYQKYAQTRSVYELLQKIYEETGYYHYMSAMPAGEKRQANLDILLEQSVEFAKYGHSGIYRFARYIESLRKADVDFGEASVNSENTNAVRIMSIHKSKGLEFPVVFAAGMGKQFNFMDMRKSTLIDGNYGAGCDYIDPVLRLKQPTLFKNFVANRMQLDLLEEETRVLYVAFTRAKEKLYITGSANHLGNMMENWLLHAEGGIDYRLFSTASMYLNWLGPVLMTRKGLADGIAAYMENIEEDAEILPHAVMEDGLFRWEILSFEDILSEETEHLRQETEEYIVLRDFNEDTVYDAEIRALLEKQQSYQYPFAGEAELPVKISVSELKRRANVLAEQAEEVSAGAADLLQAVDSTYARHKKSVENQEFADVEELKSVKDRTEVSGKEKGLVVRKDAEEEKKEVPRPEFLQEETEISGAARGTLYHMVMEHFPYQQIRASEKTWGQEEFDRYLSEMVDAGYLSMQEREVLNIKKFVTFLRSPIGKRMAEAAERGKLRLEQPFMMGIPADEIYKEQTSKEMIMVQGIIDAFFFQKDASGEENLVLVDYKTDSVKKGHGMDLVKKYQAQLDYYAQALERLTGRKVVEKVIYSFALGEELKVLG